MGDSTITGFILLILVIIFRTAVSFVLCFVPRMFRSKKSIEGQVVLITGAGNGLGRQLAIEFSKHDVCLVLVDINRQGMLETQKMLDRRSTVFIYDCDISDYKKVYEMAEKVKKDVGDVDILVNNAGIVTGQHLLDLPEEKIVKTMEVNALAHFWTCKAFLPAMILKNRGHVVSIVSIAAKFAAAQLTDYCSSKFTAMGFAESLEMELREQKVNGIKVTVVHPSHINTGLFQGANMKVGSILTPEYVAEKIVLGVLEEQEVIFIPRYFKYAFIIKEIIPRRLLIKCFEIIGCISTMRNFTGRQQNDALSTNEPTKIKGI